MMPILYPKWLSHVSTPPTLTYEGLLSFSQAGPLSQRMVDEIEDHLLDVTITSR